MRIIVCVKAVPGSTEVKMDPETNTIVRDGGQAVINPFDAAALEVALKIKDEMRSRGAPCEVVAISMGIPSTEAILRDCIARGADAGILLSDRAFAGADTLATTQALSCGIRSRGDVDLVLCGKMAVDGDTAQIGPELAGALGIPCAVGAMECPEVEPGALVVRREVDGGVARVRLPLPALITVSKDAALLRMPSIAGVLAAESVQIEVLSAHEAGADPSRIGLSGSPTQVVRSFVPERADAGVRIEGDLAEQVDALVTVLEGMGL
ncbi:MAG: electron transfer flavoprotein subunit beta/FixA family protein [Collinsella sp.]|nr:electron transfer flavoprotein subunit beta/FixA family protein [Collinsella sp.]